MINWWALLHNSFWVLGLATVLGTLGLADYEANRSQVRLRKKLGEPGFQLSLRSGVMLFCLGLLFSSQSWWEYVLWGLLAAAFAGQAVWLWRQARIARRASGGAPSPPAAPAG